MFPSLSPGAEEEEQSRTRLKEALFLQPEEHWPRKDPWRELGEFESAGDGVVDDGDEDEAFRKLRGGSRVFFSMQM